MENTRKYIEETLARDPVGGEKYCFIKNESKVGNYPRLGKFISNLNLKLNHAFAFALLKLFKNLSLT